LRKAKEKRFGKTGDEIFGVIMDAGEPVPAEREQINQIKKSADKFSQSGDFGIVDIVGRDLLSRMQLPLSETRGMHSAVLSEGGRFICSAEPKQLDFNIGQFDHSHKIYIKINNVTYAVWIIASDDYALIERYRPVHEILAECLTKLASSYVMVYNEMTNTEHANKLLSETIEQQMLLNNIYGKVLNEFNAETTVQSVIELTGEFLRLDNVIVCEDFPDAKKCRPTNSYCADNLESPKLDDFKYSDYPELIEELGYYETYFSNNPEHNVLGLPFTSYVASNLTGDGERYGMIIYVINNAERIMSHAEKRLLRSISQIVAAVIMRCKDNEMLGNTAQRLHDVSFHDPVLGVKNKAYLEGDVFNALASGVSGAVIALRIPNLKNINNFAGYGHVDGLIVSVLEHIAAYELLSAEPYRFSDKIFMVLLRNTAANGAKEFCDALIERFRHPWCFEEGEHYLEITAGIALYPASGTTTDDLFRAAIMSMYKAEEFGVNSYAFFSKEFENIEADNYYCTQVLRNAVENDMEGLMVRFTPVYSRENRIISCEASLALAMPVDSNSLYSPRELTKIAAKLGIDVAIDSWIVKQACEFCVKARENNPGFIVSVKATERALTTGTVVGMVKDALARTGLEADGLAVQFSERVVAANYDRFIAVLSVLKKTGVGVILDNLGSYYTVTSLMRHSGIRAAKADITMFTGKIDEFDEEYIKRVLKLARDNEVQIGVKSIQNEEQIELVQDVDWYQGEFYSRAVDAEDMILMITAA
jgi:EAL domain-containing protein (putative c-di-GMP-specific phosphodiesterase class I)/GGDEF domain-containing protein